MAGRRSFGSVRKRQSGRWEARYTHPDTGQVFYRYFTTKGDAEDFLSITDAELLRGEWLDPNEGAKPLRVWAEEWFKGQRTQKPRTLATYDNAVRVHIAPALGDVAIARLTPEQVDAWVTDQLAAGVGTATVHRSFKVLKQIMQMAVRRRYVRFNPCESVSPPGEPKRDQLFLRPEEVAALAKAVGVKGQQFLALMLLAAYGGLRWGECAGLGVQHLDLLRRRVRVERQLHPDGTLDKPKTKAGTRWVDIPSWLCDELARTVSARKPAADLAPEHADLLFLSEFGQRLHPSNFSRRIWKPAVKAGLAEHLHALRFHDLRHTAVALYLESGRVNGKPINPKELQMRMGHSSMQMTWDRYGHLFDKQEDAVVEAMPSPFTVPAADAEVVRLM